MHETKLSYWVFGEYHKKRNDLRHFEKMMKPVLASFTLFEIPHGIFQFVRVGTSKYTKKNLKGKMQCPYSGKKSLWPYRCFLAYR
jgi:hypothetical protein